MWTAPVAVVGGYLSDLRARPFVGLQLVQDPFGVLQHHVHLLPHLPLCVRGPGICRTTTTTTTRSRRGTFDWHLILNQSG